MGNDSLGRPLPTNAAATRLPTSLEAPSIGDVLRSVLEQIAAAHTAMRAKPEQSKPTTQLGTVDLELNFKSVAVSEGGWLLFGKDSKESQLEIRLATRVEPPDF